jgi:hypothetical protein
MNRYCIQNPLKTRTRCGIHGGSSPRGVASPSYIHGKFSAALPGGLRDAFADLAQGRVVLRENIALADLHVVSALQRLDQGAGLKTWSDGVTYFDDMQAAFTTKDATKISITVTKLGTHLRDGQRSIEAWRDLAAANDHKRKLVQTESRRQMNTMITAASAMALVNAVLAAVRDVEDDPRKVMAIGKRFDVLTATMGEVTV